MVQGETGGGVPVFFLQHELLIPIHANGTGTHASRGEETPEGSQNMQMTGF